MAIFDSQMQARLSAYGTGWDIAPGKPAYLAQFSSGDRHPLFFGRHEGVGIQVGYGEGHGHGAPAFISPGSRSRTTESIKQQKQLETPAKNNRPIVLVVLVVFAVVSVVSAVVSIFLRF